MLETLIIKQWINSICLKIQNLSSCLQIIQSLQNWVSIDCIKLKYLTSDVEYEKKSIRDAIRNLIKKIGIISSIQVTKVEQDSDQDSCSDGE